MSKKMGQGAHTAIGDADVRDSAGHLVAKALSTGGIINKGKHRLK